MGPASTIRSRHHARLLATAIPRHYLRGGFWFGQVPSGVYGGYPGEFTETGLGITAQYGSTGLSRVGGDDQVVCAARGTGSADMGEQASVVSGGVLCLLGLVGVVRLFPEVARHVHDRPTAAAEAPP